MSRASIKNFYPANPVINTTDLNAQYSATATATALINERNVRFEGIDTRQISTNPIFIYSRQFTNNYKLSLPSTPSVGSAYLGKSDPAWPYGVNVSEIPINHDTTGTKTTVIGNGTKFNLNGGTGVAVKIGDVIRIDMDIMAWCPREVISGVADAPLNTLALIERAKLCGRIAGSGNVYGGNGGSGMGEWFALVYPKFNVTSGVGTDADYTTMNSAFSVNGGPNLGNHTGVTGLCNPPISAQGTNWFDLQDDVEHCLILPLHHISPADINSTPAFMTYYEGQVNATATDRNFNMPPLRESTSITFVSNVNTTLFSIQLYYSGVWRMSGVTAGGTTPIMYLEGQDCDPLTGAGHFGVSTGMHIEEARWGIQIMRNV
jgi:hypothetical protein